MTRSGLSIERFELTDPTGPRATDAPRSASGPPASSQKRGMTPLENEAITTGYIAD